jgi:hypothetical protein
MQMEVLATAIRTQYAKLTIDSSNREQVASLSEILSDLEIVVEILICPNLNYTAVESRYASARRAAGKPVVLEPMVSGSPILSPSLTVRGSHVVRTSNETESRGRGTYLTYAGLLADRSLLAQVVEVSRDLVDFMSLTRCSLDYLTQRRRAAGA